MKPLLRYVGGKTQLLPMFKTHFPESCDTYYEPFVGSMAVTMYVMRELQPKRVVVADLNRDLIHFYKTLQTSVDAFLGELNKPDTYNNTENSYYTLRERFNDITENTIEKAVLFYYLNKTCFNGIYRVNKSGKFNVPYGKRKTVSMNEAGVREFASCIQTVEFHCCTFQHFFQQVVRGIGDRDFVYCDPPYEGTFTNYQAGGFSRDLQTQLCRMCSDLLPTCRIVLSNSNTDFIKDLYSSHNPAWNISIVSASRMVNSDASKRGKQDVEVIITKNEVL